MSPSRVRLVSIAAGHVGGQALFDQLLAEGFRRSATTDLHVSSSRVAGLRSDLNADLRLPLSRLGRLPVSVQRVVSGVTCARGVDLVHRLDLRLPASRREVITIHDTAWLRFTDEAGPPPHVAEGVRRARALIAPSTFAAAEIHEAFGEVPVHVIANGVDPAVARATRLGADALSSLGLRRPYILCSGGATTRKNVAALVQAWVSLAATGHQLIVTGVRPPQAPSSDAIFAGTLARATYLGLLAGAAAVVVPSLYEGFGFPAVEAMAAGVPVVATDRASLPEVCGDAALLVPPTPTALAEGLAAVLGDDDVRRRLVGAGLARAATLTWEDAVARHEALYAAVLAR